MLEIDLIRHAESEYNRDKKVQGHTDSPLTELGKRQAEMVAEVLLKRKIEALYASDLKRAHQTAEIIGKKLNIKPIFVEDFREIRLGDWEGRSIDEIRKNDAYNLELWYTRPLDAKIPGAEPLEHFRERVLRAFKKILASHDEGKIAIVSHGGVLSVIIAEVLGMSLNYLWHFRLNNASISRITFGSFPRLVLLNDVCHLDAIKSDSPSLWTQSLG